MTRYLIVGDAVAGMKFYALEDCPACNGSGKTDPHAVLGSRDAGGGVCPVCHGDKYVKVEIDAIPLEIYERMGPFFQDLIPDEDIDWLADNPFLLSDEELERTTMRRKAGLP